MNIKEIFHERFKEYGLVYEKEDSVIDHNLTQAGVYTISGLQNSNGMRCEPNLTAYIFKVILQDMEANGYVFLHGSYSYHYNVGQPLKPQIIITVCYDLREKSK